MKIDHNIKIAQYYQQKVDEFRISEDKHFNGSDAATESLKQRATCMDGLIEFLKASGYNASAGRNIFHDAGLKSSGFLQIIYFLQEKFDEAGHKMQPYIRAAQYEIALQESLTLIREIAAYLEINAGIYEKEGHQIIRRAMEFAAKHNETLPLDETTCDKDCHLRCFYENNGNRCCKIWREQETPMARK